MELKRISAALLPAFRPYLLTEAAELIAAGREDILAFGAVTEAHKTCAAIAGLLEENKLTVFSLYVDKLVRRTGIATALLNALRDACPDAAVEAAWIAPTEEFPAINAFLEKNGFMLGPSSDSLYRFAASEMRTSPVVRGAFSPAFRPDAGVCPLSSLTESERAELRADPSIDPRLALDALEDRLTPALSFCYRHEGKPEAYLVCGVAGDRDLTVLSALARKNAPTLAIFHLIAAAIHAGLQYFGGDFFCWMETVTVDGTALAHAISHEKGLSWSEGQAIIHDHEK